MGLGCAKTPAVAPHVEISAIDYAAHVIAAAIMSLADEPEHDGPLVPVVRSVLRP
jgi:hypothetical protein